MNRWLRGVLAFLLLAGSLYWVGIDSLLSAFSNISLWSIFQLVVLSFLLIWVSCIKWRLFIREGGGDASVSELMMLYLIGYFFNLFTPSFVGGDLARSYQLGNRLGSQKQALVSTFLERFTGLLAMTFLGVTAVLVGTEVTKGLELSILLFGVVALFLAALCFLPALRALCEWMAGRIVTLVGPNRLGKLVAALSERVLSAAASAQTHPKLLLHALLWSFIYHLLTVANAYVAGTAVGWESPPIGGLFVVVPIALLIGMIPLTPAGIGIQESAFLFLLKRIGATEGIGLGVGLVLRAKVVLLGLVGGLVFMNRRPAR